MRTRCQITYGLEDVSAASDAVITASYQQPFVKLPDLHARDPILPYATLEGEGFPLDGSRVLFPDVPEDAPMGFFGKELSKANGNLVHTVPIHIIFQKPHTSGGLTLVFSEETDEYATDVTITWFGQNGQQISSARVYPNEPVYRCENRVEDYYRLRLVVRAVNKGYHFLKLSRLIYGFRYDFESGDRLMSASTTAQLSLTADTAPIGTLEFSFISTDNGFDILNPSGSYGLVQEKQWVKAIEKIDSNTIPVGMYYLDTLKTRRGVTHMKCVDLMGVLSQSDYVGGLWKTPITAYDLALDILSSAGFHHTYLTMSDAIKLQTVTGYLPVCAHREALQQLAFSLGAFVYASPEGNIAFKKPEEGTQWSITPRDKVQGHTVRQTALVTGVEVYTHTYAIGDSRRTMLSEIMNKGTHTVAFSTPANSVTVSGAVLVSSHINQVTISVATDGTMVNIMGVPYTHSTVLSGTCYREHLPAAASANVMRITDATLTVDAQALAETLYARYQLRLCDQGTFFPLHARVGDRVELESQDGLPITGYITQMDADLTNGYLIDGEVTGTCK